MKSKLFYYLINKMIVDFELNFEYSNENKDTFDNNLLLAHIFLRTIKNIEEIKKLISLL